MKWALNGVHLFEQKKCEPYISDLPGGTFETEAMVVTTTSIVPYADFEIKKLTVKSVSDRKCACNEMFHNLLPPSHRRQNLIQSL